MASEIEDKSPLQQEKEALAILGESLRLENKRINQTREDSKQSEKSKYAKKREYLNHHDIWGFQSIEKPWGGNTTRQNPPWWTFSKWNLPFEQRIAIAQSMPEL